MSSKVKRISNKLENLYTHLLGLRRETRVVFAGVSDFMLSCDLASGHIGGYIEEASKDDVEQLLSRASYVSMEIMGFINEDVKLMRSLSEKLTCVESKIKGKSLDHKV